MKSLFKHALWGCAAACLAASGVPSESATSGKGLAMHTEKPPRVFVLDAELPAGEPEP